MELKFPTKRIYLVWNRRYVYIVDVLWQSDGKYIIWSARHCCFVSLAFVLNFYIFSYNVNFATISRCNFIFDCDSWASPILEVFFFSPFHSILHEVRVNWTKHCCVTFFFVIQPSVSGLDRSMSLSNCKTSKWEFILNGKWTVRDLSVSKNWANVKLCNVRIKINVQANKIQSLAFVESLRLGLLWLIQCIWHGCVCTFPKEIKNKTRTHSMYCTWKCNSTNSMIKTEHSFQNVFDGIATHSHIF